METRKDNKVFMEVFYTSSDDKSLDLIKNLAEYIEPLLKDIDFSPRTVCWACP